jgi:DNA-binding NtrC family response regulator
MADVVERAGGNGKLVPFGQIVAPRKEYQLLGESAVMREFRRKLKLVAQTEATVLLQGESGTGKEVAARLLHQWSRRAEGPFMVVNCAGLAEGVLESELFGHELGAFSGAQRLRRGAFELGQGGTVFLDEVGTASVGMQLRLLRVIESKEVQRVGGNRLVTTDVRLVAASNQPLAELVQEGRFREDLFYRLNVVELNLPPLRERKEDIELLARFFLSQAAVSNHRQVSPLSEEALAVLHRYHWPGNVRQLKHTMERAVVLDRDGMIGLDDLPLALLEPEAADAGPRRGFAVEVPEGACLREAAACFERLFLVKKLAQCRGNITRLSARIGMSRKALHAKLKQYEIDANQFRAL